MEQHLRTLEDNCVNDNSPENRRELSKCRAEFTRYLKIQESILRQKTRIKWIEEGDANTAYFHSTIKERRRRLTIKKIMDQEEQWIEGNEPIAEAAVRFYKKLFERENHNNYYDALNCLERCITEEDNDNLTGIPTIQEVKNIVFSIDTDSAPGPDGLRGCFYQRSWSIIANDLHRAVMAFFKGAILPKFYTHTCLIMIPKVDHPQKFSDLRPISLCNVSSKIIAKILNARLANILPRIISKNQSGFVKGRAITESILLARENINDIKKPNRGGNVVIKLDMTKATIEYHGPSFVWPRGKWVSLKYGWNSFTGISPTIGTQWL